MRLERNPGITSFGIVRGEKSQKPKMQISVFRVVDRGRNWVFANEVCIDIVDDPTIGVFQGLCILGVDSYCDTHSRN